MLNKEFLENLTPVEIQLVHQHIDRLFKNKINGDTKNAENLEGTIDCCPHCGSRHIVKNGHDRKTGRQKYLCRDCKKYFLASRESFFFHSKVGFYTWTTFIACEVVGLSLRDEAQITGVSRTTCFNMRHKLYDALRDDQEKQKQEGLVEIDATYTSINLKGWKKENMPRFSKKRGKHKSDSNHKDLRGISHHKVCMITAVDENDHILFKVAGLGPESLDKYEKYSSYFSKNCNLICDEKACIQNFANNSSFKCDVIPSGSFKSEAGNSLATINQLHQSFSDMLRKKHGVGIRHLQGYIDWLVMTKQMRYLIESKKMNSQIYMNIMKTPSSFSTKEVCKLQLPINLYEAYHEYGMADQYQSIS